MNSHIFTKGWILEAAVELAKQHGRPVKDYVQEILAAEKLLIKDQEPKESAGAAIVVVKLP